MEEAHPHHDEEDDVAERLHGAEVREEVMEEVVHDVPVHVVMVGEVVHVHDDGAEEEEEEVHAHVVAVVVDRGDHEEVHEVVEEEHNCKKD